ncbi:MAG: translation initiation factor IF-1 [Candidatus Amesbacteria bacterium]|nr:translation initiation factor IF-1 [Candidatus Amesbacteria bacterium]
MADVDINLVEGVVVESLPNATFRIRVGEETSLLGYLSGKMRVNHIKLLPGDKVRVEISVHDNTRGRIVFKLR